MNKYPSYYNTGCTWVNEIPRSWKFEKGKTLFKYKKEKNIDNHCTNILSLTLNGVINNDIENPIGLAPDDYATYQIFNKNDLVFKLIDLENVSTSRVGLVEEWGAMSSAYIRLIKDANINIKYFYWQYYDLYLRHIFNGLGAGVRSTLNQKDLLNLLVCIPPRDEQDCIAAYLDWKNSRITKLINIRKKQISLLEELKKAIVADIITHGLDKNAPMKYSGVEWMGQIPAHWQVVKLRQILRPFSEKNHPELPLLSVVREKGVIVRDVTNKEENHNFIPDDLSGYKLVKEGQFVMNKMKAWQGSYGVSAYNGIVSPAYFVFDLFFENKEYFHTAIRSKTYVNFFAQASDGIRVGQWDLSIPKMREIPFLIPPQEEQRQIVEYLPVACLKYTSAIEKLKKEIELLNEYRTKIIYEAVTGKIDVTKLKISASKQDDSMIPGIEEINGEE